MSGVLFTGDALFLRRHRLLLEAIRRRGYEVASLEQDGTRFGRLRYAREATDFAARGLIARGPRTLRERVDPRILRTAFDLSPAGFALKSRELRSAIERLPDPPSGLVHVFGLSSPFPADVPYAHYLDYTYALAQRRTENVVRPLSVRARDRFLDLERRAYRGAAKIFTMSRLAYDSVVDDYGVPPERVEVVGAGSNLALENEVSKTFGTRRLLFNASEFGRKGGELVLEAFERVRVTDARVRLVVVGGALPRTYAGRDGIDERGRVSSSDMRELYARSDLLLAPATNDPFPGVVIEAMARGLPAIVRDRDGMPEIVTNGSDGVVLSDADAVPGVLAETIRALLDDDARLRGYSAAARATVAQRLNWDVVAEKMEPFFRSLER